MNLKFQRSRLRSKVIKVACALPIVTVILPSEGWSENTVPAKSKIVISSKWENVTGKVIDSKGEPLAGATVKIKGTNSGTVTDANGVFRINLPLGNETLIISSIGFESLEVKVANRKSLDIVLEENSSSLDEVIVTGYTTQKKSEILGAVATITGKELEDIPAPNIAAALRNRIAGVSVSQESGRPGASVRLNIRSSSISPNSVEGTTDEPLYIIDRITVGKSQFDALDPSQVESITILKDASAAIYGAAGAKGVVLITTKRGKIGKPSFSYNGYMGISDAARTPEMLTAYEHAKALNDMYDADGVADYSKYFSDADLEVLKNSNIKSWYDELWQSALTQRHNLSFSGGTEKITFFAGGNFQNENANYADMKQDRYGFRGGINTQISESFKADIAFSLNHNTRISKNGLNATDQNYYKALITTPQWVPIQINGMPVNFNGIKNPLSIVESGFYSNSGATSHQINAAITYTPKFLKGLVANLRVAQSGSSNTSETYTAPYLMYNFMKTGNNGLLYTSELDDVSPTIDGVSRKSARLNPSLSKSSGYQGFFTLQYSKAIGKHSFSLLAGTERSESKNENLEVLWSDQQIMASDEFWAFDQTALTFRARNKGESIRQSFFSNFNYNYNEKYYLSGTIRGDASNNFLGNNVWGVYPSVGLGWVVSKEDFFKDNISFVNYFKIRANYGLTGDDRTSAYLWKERYNIDLVNTGYIYGSTTNSTANPSAVPNPSITWESARTFNLGFESSFLNDKLNFTFDYFHRFSYDQYDKNVQDAYPWYAGFLPPVVNNFENHTYGAEFSLGYKAKIAKEIGFNANVNFAFGNGYISQMFVNPYELFINTYEDWQYQLGTNRNKWNDSNFGLISKGMLRSQAEVDALLSEYPNYTIYGKVPEAGWLYYEDTNLDGKIDDSDFIPMFNRIDPIQFGITLGFKYKSFALNTNIVANVGGREFYDSRSLEKPTDKLNVVNFSRDYWTPNNTDAKFPRYDDPGSGRPSTFWAVNGTMIRINNMDVSYALPSKIANKFGLTSLRVLATGNNLWTIVNPLNYKDPYTSSVYDYPTIRTVSFGLSLGF